MEQPERAENRVEEPTPAGAMPRLAIPFAAFGAAAGLFAMLGIGAYREAARDVSPLTPMIMTAAVGAGVGELLRRSQKLQAPDLAREALIAWIAIVNVVAGVTAGGLIGFTTWGPDGVARFAIGGGAASLAFVPSCLVVFDAAKRAARARHGSLVAATDRRTVFSTVLAGIAFAGATQVPAMLSTNTSKAFSSPLTQPALSLFVCLASTIAIFVLQRQDRADRASLEAHAKNAAWMERAQQHENDDAPDTQNSPANGNKPVDLGVGGDRWTKSNDSNYRTSGRPDVVLRGSIDRALAAFDECALRRHRSLIVAASGLSAVTMSFVLRMGVFL